MAKILVTWELGLNSGHAVRLAQLAETILRRHKGQSASYQTVSSLM